MRTKEEKIELLNEHFFYELSNMGLILQYWQYLENNFKLSQFHINILIDSFLTHARNLWEFFYFDTDLHDYARAFHFVNSFEEWKKARPPKTTWINHVQKRANTQLSHLTYGRIGLKPPEKGWRLGQLYQDFLVVTKVFLQFVPDEYVDEPIKKLKEKLNV